MQTVFRVKRRLDEKQLTGLKLAKRQRLESDVPVLLTFAGTAAGDDPKTVLSVIRSHQEGEKITSANGVASAENGISEDTENASLTLTDVDELFKIYDAYQKNITDPAASKSESAKSDDRPDQANEASSEFVYDIYYLSNQRSAGEDPMWIDYNEEKFKLEQWSPENNELVNEEEQDNEAYEDEDSNAEDNPQNDYPDEEHWYSDNGAEIPYPLDDDDYQNYDSYNNMTSLEQRLYELNFFGHEDSDE